jgi:ferredoxin
MAYVITETCIGTKDSACVDVCPVDCIHPRKDEPDFATVEQLYIHPDECIDCGACEPECPWQAIFEEVAVPAVFKDDTPINYKIMEDMSDFKVAQHKKIEHPTPDQIQSNKVKWGWT